jgi:hypothetical protein
MKTIRFLLIIHYSLFVFHNSLAQQYGWTDISKNLPDYPFDTTIINAGADTIFAHISDISFINDNEGWVTTWHPFNDQNAAILHTTDGGGTWEVQTVMRPCKVIHMVDENVGYAGSDGGLIFKTTDGGQNWNYFGITGAPITGMSFPAGSDTGYVCSYMSSILQQITPELVNPISLGNSGWWNSISAPSHDLIWISEGSSVWTFDEEGLTDQPVTSANYNSIDFERDDLGWGVGNEGVKDRNPGVIAGCVGKNIGWVHLKYTEQPLYEVFALDEDHVWAAGFEGHIYYSENASDFGFDTLTSTGWSNVNFVSQPNPRPDVDFLAIFFTSLQNGFVSGEENVLLKYTQITGEEEQGSMEAGGQGSVEVFPNPTQGKFQIKSTKHQINSKFQIPNSKMQVEVVDLYGKQVQFSPLHRMGEGLPAHWRGPGVGAGTLELDISILPAGIYFVRIKNGNELIVKKIVKL